MKTLITKINNSSDDTQFLIALFILILFVAIMVTVTVLTNSLFYAIIITFLLAALLRISS